MPCAVNETTAVIAAASSKRHQPDAAPDIIAEEPEGAWRTTVGEQRRSPGRPFRSSSYWRARIAHRELALVGALHRDQQLKLEKLAQDVGLARDEVIVTGYVPDDDLLTLYNACLAFVLPSLHEGFGLPVLEIMQNQK